LAEAVRKGRKEEFAAFHAEGEARDPMSEESFLRSKLQWNLVDSGRHKTMLAYYKALIQLRKTNPVLSILDRKKLSVESDRQKKVLGVHRWQDEHKIICVMNFSNKTQESLPLPVEKNWYKIFDSAAEKWSGPGSLPDTIEMKKSKRQTIEIFPESILIYSNHV
jgi:maltooligosyltrehalose trehalohydrolase